MTGLMQVGIDFVSTGEDKVKKAYADLGRAEDQLQQKMAVGVNTSQKSARSLDQIVAASKKAENEIRRLAQAKQQGKINSGQFQGELNKISARLRSMGMDKAQSEVFKLGRSYNTATTEVTKQTAELKKLQSALNQTAGSKVRVAAAAKTTTDATSRTRQAFLNTANSIAIMDGPLGGIASRFSAFGVLIGRTGILLGSLAVTLSSLGLLFSKGFRDLVQYEVQMAKIEGVLKTTGNQAGLTARDIEIMSSRIALSTLESEDAIRSAATQLLTFKNVGKDVFEATLKAATDMAALGFGTVESEAVKLAKALEDPRQSLTSLSRSGITFTRQQRQLIVSLVESGRQAEAMDRILANVNRQVGGAGEAAARNTMAGAFDTIGQAVRLATRNFAESIVEVTGLDRAISALAATAGRFVEADNITLEDQIKAAREQVALLGPELEAALNRESASFFSSAFLEGGQRGSAIIQHELDLANQLLEVTTNRLEEEGRISAATQARTQMQQRSNALDNLQAEAEAIRDNIGLTEQQIRVNKALAAEGLLGIDISKEMDEYISSLRSAQTPQAELIRRAEEFYQVLNDSVGVGRELAEALDLAELGRQFANNSRSIEDQNSLLESQLALMDDGIGASEARRQAELNLQLAQAETLRLAKEITDEDYEQLRAAILKNQALSADLANRTAAPTRTPRSGGAAQINELQQEIDSLNKTAAQGVTPFEKYNTAIDHLNKLRSQGLSQAAYSIEIERLNDELGKSLPMVDDVADAFGNFLARGMTDFKSFADSIFKSFQNMLAQMIATAARNRILISIGATGSMAGTAASAAGGLAQGAGILGGVGAFASSIGTGLSVVGSGFAAGGLGGAATASMGAISGGIGMGGAAGLGTALGAAIPIIGAVALAVGLFRTKTKELDSGLNVTVGNMDALVETFKTVEKSRFFGLSKRPSTSGGAASSAVADPIVAAVQKIQQSVLAGAETLGVGAKVFEDFTYKLNLSLKGMTEEQKLQKLNEELSKMGDAFASLIPNVRSVAELTATLNERYSLETRLLQLQGDTQALRQRELATVNEYNRGILEQIFAVEDSQVAAQAAAKAMSELDSALNSLAENDFATMLDFNRAQAAIRMGLPVANTPDSVSMPSNASGSARSTGSGGTSTEVAKLRQDMKEMHKETIFAYSKLIKNSKDSRDTLRSFDIIGLPPERTA